MTNRNAENPPVCEHMGHSFSAVQCMLFSMFRIYIGGGEVKIDGLGSDPSLSCDSYITFYCTNFLPNGTKYQTQYFSHTVSLSVSHKHIHKDKLVRNNCWLEQNRAGVNKNNPGDCKCAVFVFIRRNELYMASCPCASKLGFFPMTEPKLGFELRWEHVHDVAQVGGN